MSAPLPGAPAPMIAERRWLVWRWEQRDGRRTKVPYRADDPSRHARSNDPESWGDHATAVAAVAAGRADGIGYALASGVVAAFDLDDALDAAGEPLPWAWDLIRECGSYTERTVGGNGLRILGFAEGSKVHRKFKVPGTASSVEAYRQAERYIVVTGAALEGYGGELRNIDSAMDALVARLDLGRKASTASTADPAKPKMPRPCDGSDLPPALFALIRDGVPAPGRSEKFFYAVGALKALGYDVDDVEELFTCFLTGIAEKFEHRLRAEIERAFGKTAGPRDAGDWFEQPPEEPLCEVDGEATRAAPLRIIDPTQYQGLPIPPRRWLIRDWAPWGYVTGLYGEGGLGKSLVAQQLQTAAAVGRPWLGLETAPVRSLGFYCEDSEEELWRRQADIDRLYGCDFGDLGAARWMSRLGNENLLIKFSARTGAGELTPLHGQIIEAARDHRAELVIIDTVSDTFGGNENDRGQVRAYVSWCLGTIAREIGGSVLCLAHPSRAGIASGSGDGGSTGWSAAFRSRLSLQMPTPEKGDLPDPDARVLSRKKANYAAREDVVKLRWRAGALVAVAPAEADRQPARPCAEVFLALLDEANKVSRNVAESSRAANYAPKLFAMHPDCDGWKVADFQRAMERLFAAGAIRVEAYGRKGDQRQRVVRTAAEPAEAAA